MLAQQRTDSSKIVDIYYNLVDPVNETLTIRVRISDNNGDFSTPSFDVPESHGFVVVCEWGKKGAVHFRLGVGRPDAPPETFQTWKHAWAVKKNRDAQIMPLDDE